MSYDIGSRTDDDDADGRSFETGRASLGSLQLTLLRMEHKFDALRTEVHYMREAQLNRTNENQRQFNDHENRLRYMEAKRFVETKSITTVIALVFPACAIIISIIALIVK